MKRSMILTPIEAAAFAGMSGDYRRAESALAAATNALQGILVEIAKAHAVTLPPSTRVTGDIIDGRCVLTWDDATPTVRGTSADGDATA